MKPNARTVAALSALSVLGVLAGCGPSDSTGTGADSGSDPAAGPESDESVAGPVCPDALPGSASETLDPASAAPRLPEVDAAWVCEYSVGDGDGDGPMWQLDGEEVEVPAAELPALTESLSGLAPAVGDRFCTEEIGSRWLLVTADAAGDTSGVIVDGFGCHDVRLTDDPAGGVLTGPGGLADELAALHGR